MNKEGTGWHRSHGEKSNRLERIATLDKQFEEIFEAAVEARESFTGKVLTKKQKLAFREEVKKMYPNKIYNKE